MIQRSILGTKVIKLAKFNEWVNTQLLSWCRFSILERAESEMSWKCSSWDGVSWATLGMHHCSKRKPQYEHMNPIPGEHLESRPRKMLPDFHVFSESL